MELRLAGLRWQGCLAQGFQGPGWWVEGMV